MDLRNFHLLVLLSCLCLQQARVGSSNSAVFLDGTGQRYFRSQPDADGELNSISLSEVAATISVLLGVAPPASLPVESSLKLDKVLMPNPFNKPHAIILLEVEGIGDLSPSSESSISLVDSTFSSRIIGSSKAQIELSEENEVSLVSIAEPVECDAECTDKELGNLAQWLGGSYVGSLELQDGELEIPLASGTFLKLHVSKKSDRAFALSLVSLINGIKMAMEMHEDFAASTQRPVELLTGCFTGIKALNEYGSDDIVQQGLEIFHMTLAKLFGLLQKSYQGEIVGVLLLNKEPSANSGSMLDVNLRSRTSRLLEELGAVNATTAEVLLVRKTLAWITGVILFISTLIGIYYLLYMPFTRDTLLYSNVKLD
uniref:Putative malate:quinone oxidoreductase n=1 Tax=Anthurium amnicola TaxID=1678845 RepID=A0A1D1ZGK5_9ARAE